MTVAVCLVIAAAPPVGFSFYLESHAVRTAQETLKDYAKRMINHVDQTVDEGVAALDRLYRVGVTLCDSSAREAMRQAIYDAHLIREIAVIESGNAILCGDSIIDMDRWVLSRQRAADGIVDVSVVTTYDTSRRSLTLRYSPEDRPGIVAHFAPDSLALDILPERWRRNGRARLSLIDGTEFETAPRPGRTQTRAPDDGADVISARIASERYPVMVDIQVAKPAVMEQYQTLNRYAVAAMSIFALVILSIAWAIARRRPTIADDISTGIRRGEFVPFYQPVINLSNGRLEGCEVLVRRRRRDGSIEVPASFIAQAELDGQIVPMTRALMRRVIRDLGDVYRPRRDLSVAFNLCAQHFRDDSVVYDIESIFSGSALELSQLVLEITERFPLADMAKAKAIISSLQALGAKVALDDAGTGHSGLAALHRLGMDIVKIDKLFVDPIGPETVSAPIVDTLVELSQSLDMSVVAEGVETLDQVRYLRARGVHTAQGYLFAPPLPASSYVALVEAMMPIAERSDSRAKAA